MRIFHYKEETGEFLGSSDALESPLEQGVFLVPAHATQIEPPNQLENHTLNFNGVEWLYLPIPEPVITIDAQVPA